MAASLASPRLSSAPSIDILPPAAPTVSRLQAFLSPIPGALGSLHLSRATAKKLGLTVIGCAALIVVGHAVWRGGGGHVVASLVTRQRLESALAWMGDHPKRGAALFAAAEAVAVVALAPASLFAMAAGALFGPVAGGAVSWAGLAAGQTAAFAVGRTLFRDRVRAWLAAAPPRWAAIDAAVGKGGWRLAALLRLSPAVPWNLLNYGLSATSLATGPYALASAAAVAPWCALFAYLGSLARSLADVLDGSAGPGGPAAAAMVAAGGALVVAAVWYVAAISKRTVEESLRGAAPGAAALAEELEGLDPLAAVEGGGGGGGGGGSGSGAGGAAASPAAKPAEVQMTGLAGRT